MYIYIAAPYTYPDPVTNTAAVIEVADRLAEKGHYPYVPHLTLFWHFLKAHEVTWWYRFDLAWLLKCDCLLRLPGRSDGADAEVHFARENGIPIHYDESELA